MSILSEVLASAAALQAAKNEKDPPRPRLKEARFRFQRAVQNLLKVTR